MLLQKALCIFDCTSGLEGLPHESKRVKDAVQGGLGAELGKYLEVAAELDKLIECHLSIDGSTGILWVNVLQRAVQLAHKVNKFPRID